MRRGLGRGRTLIGIGALLAPSARCPSLADRRWRRAVRPRPPTGSTWAGAWRFAASGWLPACSWPRPHPSVSIVLPYATKGDGVAGPACELRGPAGHRPGGSRVVGRQPAERRRAAAWCRPTRPGLWHGGRRRGRRRLGRPRARPSGLSGRDSRRRAAASPRAARRTYTPSGYPWVRWP